jgi:hypothetical protein
MPFAGLSYLAIVIAAFASFIFGAVWYIVLGSHWLTALGKSEGDLKAMSSSVPFITTGVALLLMAWALAGLLGHLGIVDVWHGIVAAFFLWVGFVATTMTVNHRFQGLPWSLSFIDGFYWLGVLLIQGAIIGAFGA